MSFIPYSRILTCGDGHLKVLDLHLKYGPIVRVAPNFLLVNHPDGINDLRGHRKFGQPEHGKDPIRHVPNIHNIIGANREDHTRYRRSLAHGFSHQAMLEQEPIITGYVDQLMDRLKRDCGNGTQQIDIVRWFNFTTFDIIGDLSFGESFDCLKNSDYHPWVELIFQSIKNLVYMAAIRYFQLSPKSINQFLNKFALPSNVSGRFAENFRLSAMKVQKRLDSGSDRPDFITSMTAKRNGSVSPSECYTVRQQRLS